MKAGSVIGKCMPRHRAQEFRKFLDEVERNVPAGLDVHVVMDNASSHKTQLIRNWFAKRPHWHQHFTPTSSSWINQVERFFALLAEKQIKRGAHKSVKAADRGHRGVHPTAQRRPKAAALDQVGRRHSGVHRALLPPHPGRPCAKWVVTSESGH